MDKENLVVKDSLTTKPVYKNNIINTQKMRLFMSISSKYLPLLEVANCDLKL